MKKTPSILFLFSFLLTSIISVAQNSILAGKITDENNNPVANAIINLRDSHDDIITAKTDSNGFYYTRQQLKQGVYSVAIIANGSSNNATSITIPADRKDKNFYNFQLNKKATLAITADDPFMAAKLVRAEAEFPCDASYRTTRMLTDSTGKVLRSYSYDGPPSVR